MAGAVTGPTNRAIPRRFAAPPRPPGDASARGGPPLRRFITHHELARDRRFRRSRSRNELFRSLPDDADEIVRVLEEIAPKIRQRVAGTALEAVFDELGPPQQRADAVGAVREQWKNLPASSTGHAAGTLVDSRGRLDSAEFQRLLLNRDNRPLSLAE